MWQRIQTLYLLLIGVAMTLLLFLPMGLGISANQSQIYELTLAGFKHMGTGVSALRPTWGLFVIDAIIVLVAFATIFLYKRRMLQIRLTIFNMLLTIGMMVYFGILSYQFCQTEQLTFHFKLWLSLPLVSFILMWLAIRGIGADEALVRASNRLR